MAFPADAVFEIDSAGASDNGGGYSSSLAGGSSVDYSQQASAQLTLTDCTTSGAASTTLTSSTGGFTDAMIGNAIYISGGTNFITGWYFITARADSNNVTLDDTPSSAAASGGTIKVGGSISTLYDALIETLVPGNKVWVASNITLTEALSISNAGTFANPIVVEGYQTTRGDYPLGANRPTITADANNILLGDYFFFQHFIVTGTASSVIDTASSSQCQIVNVKCTNSSGTSNRNAFNWNDAILVTCEGISTNGTAFRCDDGPSNLYNCYAHDSVDGFVSSASSDWMNLTNVIAEMCSGSGVIMAYGSSITNATIDDCNIGIDCTNVTTVGYVSVLNVSISNNTTYGISADATANNQIYEDYCNFYNNGTDRNNVTAGVHSTSGNPNYSDATNQDFTYTAGSACLNAGLDGSEIGLVGDAELNIGYSQNSVGGGGGTVSWISV